MDIVINNLTMDFGSGTKALDNLTTTIPSGELVSLLGPSGCGKSTTLMLLAGLYKPTSGTIFFGEQEVTHIEAEHRGIGMVFQNYALYPHLSVLKNILFPLKMLKMPKDQAMAKALAVAKMVHIDHLLDRKPGQLSGGQQQRVAIARALVKEPKVLLLDEPLSNLDAKLRLEMREEIRRIQLEVGITAIFVTHDQEEAMSISDKILLMSEGKLQQESKPQDMYNNPSNLFVAGFIGSPPINLINQPDNKVLGIRPENLLFTDPATATFSGEIVYLETIGRDTFVKVKSEAHILNVLIDAQEGVQRGQTVHLRAEAANQYYFDQATGGRI